MEACLSCLSSICCCLSGKITSENSSNSPSVNAARPQIVASSQEMTSAPSTTPESANNPQPLPPSQPQAHLQYQPQPQPQPQVKRGTACYSCTAQINQRPETGRDDFRIQINAQHHGNHICDEQYLTVIFSNRATFISCSNGSLMGPNNTERIEVRLRYHNNPNDNIGMGDFTVKSDDKSLSIVDVFMADKEGQ